MENTQKPYFPALTGLRAVAAFMVFFYHVPIPDKLIGRTLFSCCNQLYIGVSVFFVLSGFLIYTRYNESIEKRKGWLMAYFKNRFARIYPMYFLVTVITFLLHNQSGNVKVIYEGHFWLTLIMNLTLLRGFFTNFLLTGVVQGWTLTVEETFYLLAPAIMLFTRKIKLGFQVLFFYFLGYSLFLTFKNTGSYGFFAAFPFVVYATFFGRCLDFYVGIQIAIWYRNRKAFAITSKKYTYMGIASIFITIVLLAMLKGNDDSDFLGTNRLLANNLLLPFAIGAMLWGILTEQTFFRIMLETPFFQLAGKSSYCFYLIHTGIFSELLFRYCTHNYFYNFPVLVLLSVLLFMYIEEPLHKAIRKL
ncbi:acyltransferase family protein [Parasediminibacterium sp. JCM 36343]|uniref:acyltransferase family protein n=1 Tax=Parasediminibacterium sp. JCM 36343 TaxID=3374279 RepID=UPI003979E4AD